jgi:hypothetical protein
MLKNQALAPILSAFSIQYRFWVFKHIPIFQVHKRKHLKMLDCGRFAMKYKILIAYTVFYVKVDSWMNNLM